MGGTNFFQGPVLGPRRYYARSAAFYNARLSNVKKKKLIAGSQMDAHNRFLLDTADGPQTAIRDVTVATTVSESSLGIAMGEYIFAIPVLILGLPFVFHQFYWYQRYKNIRSLQNIEKVLREKDINNIDVEQDLKKLLGAINKNRKPKAQEKFPEWQFVMCKKRKKWMILPSLNFGADIDEFLLYQKKQGTGLDVIKKGGEAEASYTRRFVHWVDWLAAHLGLGQVYTWLYDDLTNGWYWIIWGVLVFAASMAIANGAWTILAAFGLMLLSKLIVGIVNSTEEKPEKQVIPIEDCDAHAAFTLRWVYIEEKLIDNNLKGLFSPAGGGDQWNKDYPDPRGEKIIAAYTILKTTVNTLSEIANGLNANAEAEAKAEELWGLDSLKSIAFWSILLHRYMALNFITWAVGALLVAIPKLLGSLAMGSVFTVAWPVLVVLFVVTVVIAAYQGVKAQLKIEDNYQADFELIKQRRDTINYLLTLLNSNAKLEQAISDKGTKPCTYIDANNYGDLTGLKQMLDPDDYKFFSRRVLKEFLFQAPTGGFVSRILVRGLVGPGIVGLALSALGVPVGGWVFITVAIVIGALIYGIVRALHFYRQRKADLAHNVLAELDMHIHLQQHKNEKLVEQVKKTQELNIQLDAIKSEKGEDIFYPIDTGGSDSSSESSDTLSSPSSSSSMNDMAVDNGDGGSSVTTGLIAHGQFASQQDEDKAQQQLAQPFNATTSASASSAPTFV